ncbi:MAG: type II toxin-antitoxin system RelE/ParE family toxin [Pseudomonadota bacterium]|nr:type II toxin-antitoxin system RelE/ParE family toxin [Pseudomonadota bacterium]
MARIELAGAVGEDLERILQHLEQHESAHVADRLNEIIKAVDVLASNPLIGRIAGSSNRELVIGSGSHGYVALYRYVPDLDIVFVLAMRGQREAGFAR